MSPEQVAAKERSRRTQQHGSAAAHTRKDKKTTVVAVVGLGYVGLPLSILSASRGIRTIGFDIDEVKVAQLERREANFLTPEESQIFKEARELTITADRSKLDHATTFIICVPTPVHEDHEPDLAPLEGAAKIVGAHLKRGDLVVVESTVNPGCCENVVLPILERTSQISREDFAFAHCPERINPGDDRWDVRTIPRVVGGLDDASLQRAVELYSSIIDATILPMRTIKEAEAVKMVENSFRDINIAFVNELAMAFDRAGIDVVNVIKGASTKPFGFMAHYPGCGVGGHCIPVDPYYLIRYGQENGFEHRFLITARRINNAMPLYTVKQLEEALEVRGKKLEGKTIALLGLAYKRDVPDMRESPATVIREELAHRGALVRTFDPYVLSQSTARSLDEALDGAHAVIVATDHSMFRALTPDFFEDYEIEAVIDGRNCLDAESFGQSNVVYRGIGRR